MSNKSHQSSKSKHTGSKQSAEESIGKRSRYKRRQPYEEDIRKREHANKADNSDVVS